MSGNRIFGWDYPPGAEHDPNAPYNQEDPPDKCPVCGVDNWTLFGDEWSEVYDGNFCSRKCEDKYAAQMESHADEMWNEEVEMRDYEVQYENMKRSAQRRK